MLFGVMAGPLTGEPEDPARHIETPRMSPSVIAFMSRRDGAAAAEMHRNDAPRI